MATMEKEDLGLMMMARDLINKLAAENVVLKAKIFELEKELKRERRRKNV